MDNNKSEDWSGINFLKKTHRVDDEVFYAIHVKEKKKEKVREQKKLDEEVSGDVFPPL